VPTELDPIFGLPIPVACPGVPGEVLNPRNTWADQAAYDRKAHELAALFVKNFEQFLILRDSFNLADLKAAGPKI
jgi:phosphoenolpyruvate carboxykinase (ATP)